TVDDRVSGLTGDANRRGWRALPVDGVREVVLGDEYLAGLRALVRRDDPAPLEHVDQPARAGVADPETALEQAHRGGLGGDDDLDRLVEQRILVGVELALVALAVAREGLRGVEVARVNLLLALPAHRLDDERHLLLRDVGALEALEA